MNKLKTLLTTSCIILLTSTSAFASKLDYMINYRITAGVTLSAKEKVSNVDLNKSISSIHFQTYFNLSNIDYIYLGIGTGYETFDFNNHDVQNLTVQIDKIHSQPIYVTLLVDFPMDSFITPYVFGNLGYQFTTTNVSVTNKETAAVTPVLQLTNGIYYVLGAGITVKDHYDIEISYSKRELKAKYENQLITFETKAKIESFSLSIGYRF